MQGDGDKPVGEPTFGELTRAFAKVGLLSFGGAAGQIAMMHRLVVDEKRWLDETRFLHALNYCMLLPGPEAQQLATYIGWLKHGVRGGIVAGLLFVIPGALVMLALSALYVVAADAPLLAGVFLGIKAAVLAIIAQAVLRIGRRSLRTPLLVALAVAAFLALFVFKLPFPVILIGCAATGLFAGILAPDLLALDRSGSASTAGTRAGRWRQTVRAVAIGLIVWWTPVALAWIILGEGSILVQLGLFFSKLAILTFGGAYALLAWLAQEAVTRGWVTALQMADGLGLAETTPGPTILVTQFVAYLAAHAKADGMAPMTAAILGALMTTWVTFAPSFLWIFAGAPYVEDLRGSLRVGAALAAVSAAIVGVVAYLGLWFGLHVLFAGTATIDIGIASLDLPLPSSINLKAAGLAAIAVGLVFALRWGLVPVIATMAALGAATALAGG